MRKAAIAEKLGIYVPLRDAYDRISRPERAQQRQRVREFFSAFVGAGDLVFDVGANDGRYTGELLKLGARVVAVEPNPSLARMLRRRYRADVVEAALGREAGGKIILYLSAAPILSTASAEWMRIARERGLPAEWTGETVEVPLLSLDELVRAYGVPHYVKIDVEGFEGEVLAGLSTPVETISFEAQIAALELAEPCFARIDALGGYRYAVSFADRLRLEHGWADSANMLDILARSGVTHADVFARRLP